MERSARLVSEGLGVMPHIVGISGVTGVGKTTLAKALAGDLKATLISWDDFDSISTEPEDYVDWYNRGEDYGEFQREGLETVLKGLKEGKNVMHPVFQSELFPTRYVIFDAPLGRLHRQTGQYIDTCVHIEVPLDVSLCRRLLRDFGHNELKTKEDLLEEIDFYLNHSRALYFDEDLKEDANLVVDGLLSTERQVQGVRGYLGVL